MSLPACGTPKLEGGQAGSRTKKAMHEPASPRNRLVGRRAGWQQDTKVMHEPASLRNPPVGWRAGWEHDKNSAAAGIAQQGNQRSPSPFIHIPTHIQVRVCKAITA